MATGELRTDARRYAASMVKDGIEIVGRTADRLQHVAGGGLVFQRFLQIGRVRVCNARYVSALLIAITACSAKVFSKAIWLSEKPPGSRRVQLIAPIALPSRNSGIDGKGLCRRYRRRQDGAVSASTSADVDHLAAPGRPGRDRAARSGGAGNLTEYAA